MAYAMNQTRVITPVHRAYRVLYAGYIVAPLIAGADKFYNYLTDWSQYLAPMVSQRIPAGQFMMGVGIVEIVAALLVAIKPKIGAVVVAAWLAGIIVNLLLTQKFYDVALRDLGLMLGAIALANLASAEERIE